MLNIIQEIKTIIQQNEFPTHEIKVCGDFEAKNIFEKAKDIFVVGNPRVWWLSLKYPFNSFPYEDAKGYENLRKYIPNEKSFWFIPEIEDNLFVAEVTIIAIEKLIGECSFFEYNLVGKKYDWLIAENDHNEILVCKSEQDE